MKKINTKTAEKKLLSIFLNTQIKDCYINETVARQCNIAMNAVKKARFEMSVLNDILVEIK